MINLKNIRFLPQAELEIWEGGSIKLPFWITEEKASPYRPIVEIWADQRSGAVIYYNLEPHMPSPEKFANTLLKAMTKPLVGPPRRPRRLRVADETAASLLREKMAELGIDVEQVAQCKLVEKISAELSKNMGQQDDGDQLPGLINVPGVAPDRAEAFFCAAATFYEQAPWRFLSDGEPLEVSCSAFSQSPLHLIIMGSGGREFGLGLFYEAEDLKKLYRAGGHFDLVRNPMHTASVLFSDPTFVSVEEIDAIEAHQWPIASPHAYPHMFQIVPENEQLLQPPSLDQIDIFEACLLAVPQLFSRRKSNTPVSKPFAKQVSVKTFHGSRAMRLVFSPQAWNI